jgi:hypothetical protein
MKTIFCLVAAMALASQCFGQDEASPTPTATPKQLKKTARMSQIETKFSLELIATVEHSKYHDGKMWLFASKNPESPFGVMPVLLKPESTDKEIESIVRAVSFCVDYYTPVIQALRERLNKQSPPEVFN